jgi:hypothetical protein
MPKQFPNEGLKPDIIRAATGHTGDITEDFLKREVWWWQTLDTWSSDPEILENGDVSLVKRDFKQFFRMHWFTSAYRYELSARFEGRYEFGKDWNRLSGEQKGILANRWPEPYRDTFSTVAYVGGELTFEKRGWSAPKILSFKVDMSDDAIFQDLKVLLAEWRDELGITERIQKPTKPRKWDIIEYMDRRRLLNEKSDSNKTGQISGLRKYYLKEIAPKDENQHQPPAQ